MIVPFLSMMTAEYTGMATPVNLAFNFPVVSDFISSMPGPILLAEFGFRSSVPHIDGASDLTTFNGTFALTYTFGVPEPSSLVLLGLGVGLVLLLTRRCRV